MYVGLIGIGAILVQPFLTARSLDLSAKICVISFSVAIPLLAALVMVNQQEAFRRRRTPSVLVAIARSVALSGSFVGVVAGFWHILWIAGVGMLAGGLVGVAVHSAGYVRLELPAAPTSQEAEGEAEAGAFADGLGGVAGLEDVGADGVGDTWSGVADLDQSAVAVAAGPDRQGAVAVHGVDGVVDQVGPDLIQLARVGEQLWQRAVVVAYHLDACAEFELVREHRQGCVEPVMDIDLLQRRPVHLGVLFGFADKPGDAPSRVGQLVEQAASLAGGRGQPQRVGEQIGGGGGGDLLQPGGVHTGGDQRRSE